MRPRRDLGVAEFAVIVQHDLQGRGLAAHLMRRLLDWAPLHGVREVVGEILAENAGMIDLARHRVWPAPPAGGSPNHRGAADSSRPTDAVGLRIIIIGPDEAGATHQREESP